MWSYPTVVTVIPCQQPAPHALPNGGVEVHCVCCSIMSMPIAVTLAHRAGSIEYAIAEDRMTDDGGLWVPLEEDVTLKR